MAQTKDIGRVFFYISRVQPGTPFVHTAVTVMIEKPFRRAQSVIIRLPRTRALIVGLWRDTGWGEERALMEAVSGWGVDPYDDALEQPEVKATIRENIASSGLDLDAEWTIIDALGVSA